MYFPSTRHYVTSADVTFHEDVPFFQPSALVPVPLSSTASPPLDPLLVPIVPSSPLEPLPSVRPDSDSQSDSHESSPSDLPESPPMPPTSLSELLHPFFLSPCLLPTLTYPLLLERALVTIPNILSVIKYPLLISPHPIVPLPYPSFLGQYPRHILKLCRYRSGRLPWMLNMPHFFNERLGSWCLARAMSMSSHASGCTPSSTIQMAPSLATRHVLWLGGSPKPMVLTILRPSLLWLASVPFVFSSL